MNIRFTNTKIYLFLLLIAIAAFWQIAFLQNSVKWDLIEVVFPWRYYVGECLQNNTLPLWNPYQQLGYPMYADLQHPWWYAEQLVIGFLFGYSNYTIHFLLIAYVWLAGVGMFKLCDYFIHHRSSSFIIACSYMLSGFFVGHAQSLTLLIGGAFVPLVLYNYLKLIETSDWERALKTSVFLFLLITGGYQALTIILGYLFLTLFVAKLLAIRGNRESFIKFLSAQFLLISIIVLECMFLFLILKHLDGQTSRVFGGTVQFVNELPFTPQALLSLLVPYAVVENISFFNTDLSLTNGYIGIIVLLFSVYSILFISKTKTEKILLIFGLIALLASFGASTPVRGWLYYLPMLNTFRFAGVFRLFAMIILLLLAGKSLKLFLGKKELISKKFLTILLTVAVCLILIASFAYTISNPELKSFKHHILIHVVIQFVFLSIVYICIKKQRKQALMLISIADLLVATQLNAPYTVFSNENPRIIHEDVSCFPAGFVNPSLNALAINSDGYAAITGVGRNCNIFKKEISYDGYSSFWLTAYDDFFYNHQNLKRAVLQNPFIYLSANISSLSNLPDTSKIIEKDKLYMPDKVYAVAKNLVGKSNSSDKVNIIDFNPQKIVVEVEIKEPQLITLLQSNFPGWKVFIDGEEGNLFKSNLLFMSAFVKSGKHEIVFQYSNKPFIYSLLAAYIVFLTVLLILAFQNENFRTVVIVIIVVGGGGSLKYYYNSKNNIASAFEKSRQEIKSTPENYLVILNTDRNNTYLKGSATIDARYEGYKDLIRYTFLEQVAKQNQPILYVQQNVPDYFELNLFLKKYFNVASETKITNGKILLLEKLGATHSLATSFYCDYQKEDARWRFNKNLVDTSTYFSSPSSFNCKTDCEYAVTFKLTGDELTRFLERKYVTVSLKFKPVFQAGACIVFTLQKEGKPVYWENVNMVDFTAMDGWSSFFTARKTETLKSFGASELLIYIWNKDKNEFWIDDFEVKAFD